MTNASSIEQKIYAKSSLVGISHGLEDMVVEFKLKLDNIDKIIMCKNTIDLKFNKLTNEDIFSVLFNNSISFLIEG